MSIYQEFPSASHKVGLGLIASAGLVSTLSTLSLLSYIAWNAFSPSEKLEPVPRGLRIFTLSSLGCYLISLLLCDFLQGVAFSLNFQWAAQGLMVQGHLCEIQGIVSQIGDLGAAIWSTAIAFHTFWLLFLIKQPHRFVVLSVLICGWSILILLAILGPTVIEKPTRGSFYGLSGAWCWIGTGYGVERVIYLYGWVFGALGISFIVYSLIYLRFSGFITFNDDGKIQVHFHRPPPFPLFSTEGPPRTIHPPYSKPCGIGWFSCAKITRNSSTESEQLGITNATPCDHCFPSSNTHVERVARRIMWYPLVYAVVVIPVAICRMGVLAGWQPPFGLLVFSGICFASSGLSNTLLFVTTRKNFITQTSRVPVGGVRVTTQQFAFSDHSACNQREIPLDPIKFTPAQLVSPHSTKGAVVLYNGPRSDFDSCEGRVMIIDHHHIAGDKYVPSN